MQFCDYLILHGIDLKANTTLLCRLWVYMCAFRADFGHKAPRRGSQGAPGTLTVRERMPGWREPASVCSQVNVCCGQPSPAEPHSGSGSSLGKKKAASSMCGRP